MLVRVHSECLTGDVFHSLRCDCGEQMEARPRGHRDAGQRACSSTCGRRAAASACSTSSRPTRCRTRAATRSRPTSSLGFADDLRDYGVGAQILRDLGVGRMELITNNPRKIVGLEGYGLEVAARVPLEVAPQRRNIGLPADEEAQAGTSAGAGLNNWQEDDLTTWQVDPSQSALGFRSNREVVSWQVAKCETGGNRWARCSRVGSTRAGAGWPSSRSGSTTSSRSELLAGAQRLPRAATASQTTTSTWPGCRAASSCRWWRSSWRERGRYGAVVCLGCLIQGDTPHFQLIAAEVTKGIAQVALETGVPGDLRRDHRRDARAGHRARGHEGGQQGVRRRALGAGDDGSHGADCGRQGVGAGAGELRMEN